MGLLDLDWHIMAAGSQISLCYPTVTCCCELPRDYTQTVLYYIYLSLFYVLLEAVHVIHTLCVVYAIPKGQCNDLICAYFSSINVLCMIV